MEGRAKKIEGNVDYPINRGKHSARCEAGLQALYHPDRIRGPLVRTGERGSGQYEEISWTDAIGRLTYQLDNLRAARNQKSVVLITEPTGAHVGNVVDRFMARYRGRHMTYEVLEQTNLRRAIKQVFNEDRLPDFDIDNSGYVLSFGSDFLNTWVSPVRYARGYGHFRQGERERGTLVQVESRFSMTAANADEWLFVRPGQEGLLALSMAHVIVADGLAAPGAAEELTGGDLSMLDQFAPEQVEARTGVPYVKVRRIAHDFAAAGNGLAIGGGSAAAHSNGLFNLTAIYSLNHLVGSFGRDGGVIPNPAPPIEGLAATPEAATFDDWQELIAEMKQGDVQVLMVKGANPMYGLPNASGFRDASYDVPFIFSFSGRMDDTTAMSDLVLPAHNYLEDWGSDVPDPGPGHQVLGFQQPVVRPFFESRGEFLGTKNFPDVLMAIAESMELDLGLPGESFLAVLQAGARELYDNRKGTVGKRPVGDYPSFEAFWNAALQHGLWEDESATYSGTPPTPPALSAVGGARQAGDPSAYPYRLAPFASASMLDGGLSHLPWLQATPDPITTATWQTWVELSFEAAEELGIREGDRVRVVSETGSIEALAYPTPASAKDIVSVPAGQGHRAGGRYTEGRGSNVLSIVSPLAVGGSDGLAWAGTRVKIEKMGGNESLPKFENTAPDLAVDEGNRIIGITPTDT
jgi:anaerobic selenocysteine-containing dehydrogenase